MAVLEIVQSDLANKARGSASAVTGTSTSTGHVNTGSSSRTTSNDLLVKDTINKDQAGAGILTALIIIGVIGGIATMNMDQYFLLPGDSPS